MSAAWRDPVRQAWRSARRHPAHSLFAIVALAAAIGGGTLLFALWDAIALRKLAVDRPDEIVSVRNIDVGTEGEETNGGGFSLDDFEALRKGAAPWADLSAYAAGEGLVGAGGRAQREGVHWVDARYFAVLGVRAREGRVFVAADDPRRGGTGGVVLSDAAWTRLFSREPGVVGTTVRLDGRPRAVLGVLPPEFGGFAPGSEPAIFSIAADAPPGMLFQMLGRLRTAVPRRALEARLGGVLAAVRANQPGRQTFVITDGRSGVARERVAVVDGSRGESVLRGEAGLPLALVGGMIVLVLLVLAANLGNLLAVRALAERGAAAVRLALGAPRSVIAAGWLAEALLLTVSGAVLGIAGVAWGGSDLLRWTPLPGWVHGLEPSVDGRVAAVAGGAAVLIALLVGGVAAREQLRVSPALRLREESPSASLSRGALLPRHALIAAQVALSVVLIVAMGLFVRSAAALLGIDTGFPLEKVVTFSVDLPGTVGERSAAEMERLREDVARLPGVSAAGFSETPVLGGMSGYAMTAIEGYRPRPGEVLMVNTVRVAPGFFAALDLPLVSGRLFEEDDAGIPATSPGTAVVNRRFAERYFAGTEAVGRRVSFDYQRTGWAVPAAGDLTIVGVVDDRMVSDVRDRPAPRLYALPSPGSGSAVFYLRTAGAPMSTGASAVSLLRRRAPDAGVGALRTLKEQRDRSLRRELLIRDLTMVFGVLAASLAGMGLFAVLSYVIGERGREFGIRQALGATAADLTRGVLADAFRPVAAGLAAGVLIAAAASRLAASQLYGVQSRDPRVYAAGVAAMAAIALAACLPAALRAARIDPARALGGR